MIVFLGVQLVKFRNKGDGLFVHRLYHLGGDFIMTEFKSLNTVENIIEGLDLPDFQNIGVQKALLNNKMLLAFDTGTGKTYTYSVFVRALLNNNPEGKHIFVIIHDSINQAPSDIANLISAPVFAFSGKYEDYKKFKRRWNEASVIILTYECFQNMELLSFLYDRLTEVESFVIDEAHHVSGWDVSDTAFIIRSFTHYIPYVIALTATPITSRKEQYYQIMNILDRNLSPRRDETFLDKYSERYMAVNRSDYLIKGNYKTILELVEPSVHQIGEIKGIISRVIKGTGAVNQVNKLLCVVKEKLNQNKKVIIYVNYHDTREWIEKHFDLENIKYVSLHGRITKQDERKNILNRFNDGDTNVLITSVSESLNITSDVVIFYEFTTKIKQVMGRAHRGLGAKELELIFIITKDTMEIDYFMKYIYKRSLIIQNLLGKDYQEFIDIGNKLNSLEEN